MFGGRRAELRSAPQTPNVDMEFKKGVGSMPKACRPPYCITYVNIKFVTDGRGWESSTPKACSPTPFHQVQIYSWRINLEETGLSGKVKVGKGSFNTEFMEGSFSCHDKEVSSHQDINRVTGYI